MSEPVYIDCRGIMEKYGFKKRGAEAIMRPLTKLKLPDPDRPGEMIRKVYVRRSDVQRFLDERERAA